MQHNKRGKVFPPLMNEIGNQMNAKVLLLISNYATLACQNIERAHCFADPLCFRGSQLVTCNIRLENILHFA